MIRPFIIYALPRSRTAWLSTFLTYRDWKCHHEPLVFMRKIEDIVAFFWRHNSGMAESAAGPGWRLIHHYFPGIRAVVIHRPIEDVIGSMMRLEVPGFRYEEEPLRKVMTYGHRVLQQIAQQPG